MQERKIGNYAVLQKEYLYLALGVHYIMFRLEKKVEDIRCARYPPIDTKYGTESWKKIISTEELDASYNPSYDRLSSGIIDFTLYIQVEGGPFELKMAMDLFYHPIDAL
jgi:hypothetical protein